MHIPQCETNEVEILDFAPALESALQPADDYDVARWLFVPNQYDEYPSFFRMVESIFYNIIYGFDQPVTVTKK